MKLKSILMGFLIGCGGDSATPEPEQSDPCEQPFINSVEAATWARAVSSTQSYRYSHDLSTQIVEVELVGAESEPMRMWQVYDHDSIPDGALRAELGDLSLTTTGRTGPGLRHEVHATLSNGAQSAEIVARFTHERCFDPDEGANSPACAGNLEIGGGIILPSCGLIADNVVLSGIAPVLRELEYRVPVAESSTNMGGRRVDERGEWNTLLVRSQTGTMPAAEVATWLNEVGAHQLFLSEDMTLLTTAFLDRTWWREMDRQIAQCSFVAAGGMNLPQASGNGCNGDYCPSDWSQGSGQNGGNNAWGDPHMTSLDRHAFDFQGAGEYVLVRSTSGDPIEIQMRARPLSGGPPACGKASTAIAIATKVGDTRVVFNQYTTSIDGVITDPATANIEVPEGASVTIDPSKSVVRWPDGSELWVRHGSSMGLGFNPAPVRAGKVEGILGNFDGDTTNDFALPSGEVIPMPASFEDIHRTFGDAWRVTQESSLFDYEQGADTSTFTVDGFPGSALTIEDFPVADAKAARAECLRQGVEHETAMTGCVIDTLCSTDSNNSIAADARDQPLPVSAQKPGETVATGGAVERVDLPETLDAAPWAAPASTCEPRMRKNISLYAESSGVVLATDVDLAATAPGRYDNDSKLDPSSLPNGTVVDSWIMHRAPGPVGEAPLRGFVRFDRPIVGVVVGSSTLNATDDELGAGITYDVGNARGLELGGEPDRDWFEISSDRKQLRVQLSGDTPDQIRILTEVQ